MNQQDIRQAKSLRVPKKVKAPVPFLQSSSLLAFSSFLVWGPGPKSSRRKEGMTLTASDKEQDTRAQFQEPKAAVKLEKKKQDTEPSIHLPMTRCKFRQDTQRGEAAKRRAAKNAQATSALVFCRGPHFLNHTRMTASPPQYFCIEHKAILHWANHLKRKEMKKQTLHVYVSLCKIIPRTIWASCFTIDSFNFLDSCPSERHRNWTCNSWRSRTNPFFSARSKSIRDRGQLPEQRRKRTSFLCKIIGFENPQGQSMAFFHFLNPPQFLFCSQLLHEPVLHEGRKSCALRWGW